MRNLLIVLGLTAALGGCTNKNTIDIPTGTDVTVERTDGVTVAGHLVEVQSDKVVVESRDGVKTSVLRTQIASIRPTPAAVAREEQKATTVPPAAPAPEAPAPPAAPVPDDKPAARASDAKPTANDDRETATAGATDRKPEYRELTLPAGTTLTVALTTLVGSDTSHVEDPVHGTLRNAVRIDGFQALPVGTALSGHVTLAQPAGKVKGRASIGFRFSTIDLPGDHAREPIKTATYSRTSRATKQKDATKIGVGAGAGAVIGGILGGGGGAAKGAAIGGGAGTAVVLSTKGDEVRIPAGTAVTISLTAPLTVQVPIKK